MPYAQNLSRFSFGRLKSMWNWKPTDFQIYAGQRHFSDQAAQG